MEANNNQIADSSQESFELNKGKYKLSPQDERAYCCGYTESNLECNKHWIAQIEKLQDKVTELEAMQAPTLNRQEKNY